MKTRILNLDDLFFDQLRDIHSVESQVAETLPHLLELASLPTLRERLDRQLSLTLEQKRQVATVFRTHAREPGSDPCLAMKGLIEGGNEHLTKTNDHVVRDALLAAHWLRIKHYEIAAYQSAAALALHLEYLCEGEMLLSSLAAEEQGAKDIEEPVAELFAGSVGRI